MKKSHLAIIALSISVHSIGWGMLTVSKIQPRPAKKYFTQEKIERDELRASEESEMFLNSFGQHSLNKTGVMFCDLPIKAKKKVLPCLSHNQKLLVWFGAQGLEIPILTVLCNGNKKVAHRYRNEPLNEVLKAYARAKEWQNFAKIDVQHLMVLTNKQIRLFIDVENEQTIHGSDIHQFMNTLEILDSIDPGLLIERKKITDLIKLYPSLSERAAAFWSTPSFNNLIGFVYVVAVCSSWGNGALYYLVSTYSKEEMALLLRNNAPNFVIDIEAKATAYALSVFSKAIYISGGIDGLGFIGQLILKYRNYQNHLKINILPNQPTLTDCLKKTAL